MLVSLLTAHCGLHALPLSLRVCRNKGISGSVATAKHVVRDEEDDDPSATGAAAPTGQRFNKKFASNSK